MIINCTKKLQDEIGIKPNVEEIIDPLFSWHANIIRVNRRKTLVLVNDASRYTIILHGIKSKELKNIGDVILSSIRAVLLYDCVNPEIIDDYINKSENVIFSKTQLRTLIARLNKGCEYADILYDLYDDTLVAQGKASKRANQFIHLTSENGKTYSYPYEVFYEQLEKTFNKPVICCKALKLKCTMQFENFNIWREVIVPLGFTFEQLHKVLQKLFNWLNYHLHDFLILDREGSIVENIKSYVDDEYDDVNKIILESDVRLDEYLPKYKSVLYNYDFGDNWEHLIEVEDLLFYYDKNYAFCTAGDGDAPPEDVGGEGGFEEFTKIMSDPNHEEYNHMKEWAYSNQYECFAIDKVNRDLNRLY